MYRRRFLMLAISLVLLAAAPALRGQQNPSDGAPTQTGVVSGYAMVILADPPLADWPGAVRTANGKIDFTSGTNGRYQAALAHARNDFKQWLRSSGSPAQVIREYDTVLQGVAVRLNGATLDSLRGGPGVTLVEPSLSYTPVMDRSLDLISASAAWAAVGGVGSAGAGVKVGVIDTGIDQTHPFLTDNSLNPPQGFPKFDPGNQQFTSRKVIVARVYFTGKPGLYTAQALQEHGTHVSGTIAGVHGTSAPATADHPSVSNLSGVAPKAFLGNYNVFPGQITNASSHDIAQAIEDAVKDGMDVINMSLGGGINGYQDQLTVATNRAVDAGVIVAVAAGNAGPGVNTVESPGQAANAITAAASTNSHYFGVYVHVGAQQFGAAVGSFNPYQPAVTATLTNWDNLPAATTAGLTTQACSASAVDLTGKIVIIDRGTCSFSAKIRFAQDAHAAGVLMVNNAPGDPIAMGGDGTPNQPTIPAVMLDQVDRPAIRGLSGSSASVDGSVISEVLTNNGDYLASFSGRGPANLLDIKPDVTAPGVNIFSSIPGPDYAMFQGTSMATPHVAGSAALLVQLHPDWTPAMVKSALVDSAYLAPHLLTTNPMNVGGGVVDLGAATSVPAVLSPAVLSFRKIEPGSAQSKTMTVTVTNVTGAQQTFDATATIKQAGASVSVSPASLSLGAGKSGTVSVTVSTTASTPTGQYYGQLVIEAGAAHVTAPFWFAVRTTTDAGPLQ